MRSLWSLATVLSLIVWASFVTVQAKKSARPAAPPLSSPTGDLNVKERDEWFSFTQRGKKVGFAHLKLEETAGGYSLSESFLIKLRLLGEVQEIRSQGVFSLKEDFSLRSFFMNFISRGVSFLIRGSAGPESLAVSVEFPGSEEKRVIPLKRPIYVAASVKPFLAAQNLKPGDSLSIEVFDPVTSSLTRIPVRAEGYERIKVKGTAVNALRIATQYGGATFKTWLGPSGETVKEQGLLGITLVAATEKEATRGVGEVEDIYRESSVPLEGRLTGLNDINGMKLKLLGADMKGFDLSGGRQFLDGDSLVVSRERLPKDPPYLLPYPERRREMRVFLRPSFLIQSDHEEVVRAAKDAVGRERDPVATVRLIIGYMDKTLEKRPTVALPDALSTLKRGYGDCNEYTALFCGLARAVGLPSRPVAGLVFSRGRFYYHAWAEVFLGRWITVDPLMGQFPADISHLRMVQGGLDKQVRLAGLMGRLRLRLEKVW